MLVGAFEIEVGRPVQVLVLGAYGEVARTGVDPHVERVGALAHVLRPGGRDGGAGEDFLDGRGPPPITTAGGDLLGDVIISLETATRQAREGGVPTRDEVMMLLAHGLLHLLGWDHQTDADDRRMRAETDRMLAVIRRAAAAKAKRAAAG